MFGEFYGMCEPREQEVVALIKRCIGGGHHNKEDFWGVTAVTLGMVFCDTGKVSSKEERLGWPVTGEKRDGEKGWGCFHNEQICRLGIHQMREEWAQSLAARLWCTSEVVGAHEDCPELQAILDEHRKPVVIQDEVLGELTLDKDHDTLESEIRWYGKDVRLSLEVNAESKPSWARVHNAVRRLVTDRGTWGKVIQSLAAENLTRLANNWPFQDEGSARNPEIVSITEEEFAQYTLLTEVSVSPGGRFTTYCSDGGMSWGHTVEINDSLKEGITYANFAG